MEKYSRIMDDIVENVEKVIIGKRSVIELVLCAFICKGHILIEDVPGVGKTSLISALAASIDCSFKRIQFTPDILPSDVTGYSVFNQKTGSFEYRQGAVMSQIVLADEINRTSPKTQSSLLEVMEEYQVTVDGKTYPAPKPFMVLATQNPIEYVGTYPLPEAQLDRFFMKLSLGYPNLSEESDMLKRYRKTSPLEDLRPVSSASSILEIQDYVCEIFTDEKINDYIVRIISATRENPCVLLGASPRASICLYKAAQARALFSGRTYVIPDDVQYMAPHILSHRILMKHEAKIKKMTALDVIHSAIQDTSVPILVKMGK